MAKGWILAAAALLAGCTLSQRNSTALALCEEVSGCTTTDDRGQTGPSHVRDMDQVTPRAGEPPR